MLKPIDFGLNRDFALAAGLADIQATVLLAADDLPHAARFEVKATGSHPSVLPCCRRIQHVFTSEESAFKGARISGKVKGLRDESRFGDGRERVIS
jgi:hypothetical protein